LWRFLTKLVKGRSVPSKTQLHEIGGSGEIPVLIQTSTRGSQMKKKKLRPCRRTEAIPLWLQPKRKGQRKKDWNLCLSKEKTKTLSNDTNPKCCAEYRTQKVTEEQQFYLVQKKEKCTAPPVPWLKEPPRSPPNCAGNLVGTSTQRQVFWVGYPEAPWPHQYTSTCQKHDQGYTATPSRSPPILAIGQQKTWIHKDAIWRGCWHPDGLPQFPAQPTFMVQGLRKRTSP